MKIAIYQRVTPCNLVAVYTDNSEQQAACIIREYDPCILALHTACSSETSVGIGRHMVSKCIQKPNTETRSYNHCYHGIAISIAYSEYVFVALGIEHSMCMRRILLASVACPALQYFPTLSYKRHDSGRKKII
jgi:hypothetical protein